METTTGSLAIKVSYNYIFTFDTKNEIKFWLNDELIFDSTNLENTIVKHLKADIYEYRVQYDGASLISIVPDSQIELLNVIVPIFPKEIKISMDRPMKFEFNVDDRGVVKVLPK